MIRQKNNLKNEDIILKICQVILFSVHNTSKKETYLENLAKTMKPTKNSSANCATFIILGSGGHTAEMCTINKALMKSSHEGVGETRTRFQPCYYLVASTDTTSRLRVIDSMRDIDVNISSESFIDVPRSREVGQSWLSTIFTAFWSLVIGFWLVWRYRPQLVLCNGPGTCVPFCLAAYCCRLVGRLPRKSKIVFVESFCRVRTMSLSGRLLQPLVDLLVVQWEPLFQKYCHKSNVKYFGRLM